MFKLYEFQLAQDSRIEAGYCLHRIVKTLTFENVQLTEDWARKLLPDAKTESEVKELTISLAIEIMDETKVWKDAIQLCKSLEEYYTQLNEFEQLSDILRLR
jgi:hypothetical protein